MARTNAQIKNIYDSLYQEDNPFSFDGNEEAYQILNFMPSWKGLDVLEIGCGEGRLSALIAERGANVLGIDYSEEAIRKASEKWKKPDFAVVDIKSGNISRKHDVVVMQGVLEHLDDPWNALSHIIKHTNCIITSSPAFLNPRGYVWMTFQYLLGIEMSLADLHFINPWDMEKWCDKNDCDLSYVSVDQDWGCGERAVQDYAKRFRSEIFQKKIPLQEENIQKFLDWFESANLHFDRTPMSGANIVYKVIRK